MRLFLILLHFLVASISFGQNLSDKYLHFKTNFYWDTTLYKSEQDFYYKISNGRIIQNQYPVLEYSFSEIISEKPFVQKAHFERANYSFYPYKYVRKGSDIYISYFDLGNQKQELHREYSLNIRDTVKRLVNKSSLASKDGISVGGFSTYLGEAKIVLNGKCFNTFRFLEDHDYFTSHPNYYTEEVFLDQTTLIPIKFITLSYDYYPRQKKLYSSITELASSSNVLPDYTHKKTEDLVLYENKNHFLDRRTKGRIYQNVSS